MDTYRNRLLLGCALVAASVPFSAAQAQEAPAAQAQEAKAPVAPEGPVPDIIVTAERRGVAVQKTSLTVTAVSNADLEARAISSAAALQGFVPSLSITDAAFQKFINIRGVGQSASLPGIQAGTVYSVDGIYGRTVLNEIPYYDIERIEVLRGPQGTLSGQNATGGAINVLSQQAVLDKTGGYGELSYGNYNHAVGEGALNLPIGEHFAIRGAIYAESRDSYFKMIPSPGGATAAVNSRPGNVQRTGARLSLYGELSDRLTISLRGEYFRRTSDGIAMKPVPGDPSATFGGIAAATVAPSDPFTIDYDTPEKADVTIKRLVSDIRWGVTDSIQLRSLTGYVFAQYRTVLDIDATGSIRSTTIFPGNVQPNVSSQQFKIGAFSQEFNLLTTGTGPLQGVLGAYYNRSNTPGTGPNGLNISVPAVEAYNPKALLEGYAVFGQATYALTPNLKIVGGLRYNHDRGDLEATVLIKALNLTIPANQVFSSNAVTGKASIEFQASPNQFLYATVARGYKSGGGNPTGVLFSPEYVWNYEGGLKSSFAHGALRTRIAAFYDQYQGFQAQVFDPLFNATVLKNIGDAEIYGVEAEAEVKIGAFSANGSLAAIHTKFGQLNGQPITITDTRFPAGDPRQTVVITGKRLPYAQNLTASAGMQYEIPFAGGSLTPRVDLTYGGGQWSTIFDQAPDYVPSRALVNLRMTYAQGPWSLAFFMTNVADKTYISGKYGGMQQYGAPREFGVKLRASY